MNPFAATICINGAHLSDTPPVLAAAPGTDIANGTGSPARSRYAFSAPLIYHVLRTSDFQCCRATFRCVSPAGYGVNLDQAGLILVWPRAHLPRPSADDPGRDADTAPNYVMAGLEAFRSRVRRSCVENVGGVVDWSSWPAENADGVRDRRQPAAGAPVTVELVRAGEKLIVRYAGQTVEGSGGGGEGEQRVLFRTIGWCFQPRERDEVMWVGFFAARPDWDGEAHDCLEVAIDEFLLQSDAGVVKVV